MATKFGTKRAINRLAQETFAPIGGFAGWAIKCCQLHFPRPTPVAMATEFETKLAIARLAYEIFAPIGGFSGMGHQMLPIAFFPDWPPLPWQQNLGQNWL